MSPLPRKFAAYCFIPLALVASGASGCAKLQIASKPLSKSLLSEARLARESVVLDLFFVRLPQSQPDAELWRELDEQIVAPPMRQALAAQGFRVGRSASHPPQMLEKLLNQLPASTPHDEGVVAELEFEPIVSRRHLQLPGGGRAEINASRAYDTMTLLEVGTSGEVSGVTLKQAQAVFIAQAVPQADGRVLLKLLPEIHHGEAKPEIVPHGQSHFLLESRRPRKTFDQLAIETPLAPGEMLVLGALPNRASSAGNYFFSEKTATGTVRKLLVVRVSQTQHDAALAISPDVALATP